MPQYTQMFFSFYALINVDFMKKFFQHNSITKSRRKSTSRGMRKRALEREREKGLPRFTVLQSESSSGGAREKEVCCAHNQGNQKIL